MMTGNLAILKARIKRPVFYLPANKGNAVVIIDKGTHVDLVRQKLEEGKFHVIRKDPLPGSVKRVKKALAQCRPIIKKAADLGCLNHPGPESTASSKYIKKATRSEK